MGRADWAEMKWKMAGKPRWMSCTSPSECGFCEGWHFRMFGGTIGESMTREVQQRRIKLRSKNRHYEFEVGGKCGIAEFVFPRKWNVIFQLLFRRNPLPGAKFHRWCFRKCQRLVIYLWINFADEKFLTTVSCREAASLRCRPDTRQ